MTEGQVKEFEGILGGLKGYESMFKELSELAKMEGDRKSVV